MTAILVDDGTFDTVVRCLTCGHESRYNWDGGGPESEETYDDFCDWALSEFLDEHDCDQEDVDAFQADHLAAVNRPDDAVLRPAPTGGERAHQSVVRNCWLWIRTRCRLRRARIAANKARRELNLAKEHYDRELMQDIIDAREKSERDPY